MIADQVGSILHDKLQAGIIMTGLTTVKTCIDVLTTNRYFKYYYYYFYEQ